MKVLITGGAGFIGSHTAERLVLQGVEVRVFDDLSTGKLANLQGIVGADAITRGNVLDLDALTLAMAGCDAVLHLAAVVSVPESIANPARTHAVNATGALNVLEAARQAGVRRVVLASSAAVYGANQNLPLAEQETPECLSPYAAQKWQNESYARCYAELHGLSTICLRYFNVFGPRQDPASPYSGVLSRFIAAVADGVPVTIHGDGGQTRDFVFVGDVAQANCQALLAPESVSGVVVNVGTGRPISVLAAYQAIMRHCGIVAHEPSFGAARLGDIRHSLADTRQAQALLGYAPVVGFDQGIVETLRWARARDPQAAPLQMAA